jgi:hypothetical protein
LAIAGRPQRPGFARPGRSRPDISEGLPGRRVEREDQPAAEREGVYLGRAREAGDRDDGQHAGVGGVKGLRGQQDAPLRQPVGYHSRVQAERQYRQELQRHRHADGGRAMRQAEYQPVLGDALHPGAHIGQALAAEVDPVAARGKGGEGAPRRPDRLGGGHWMRAFLIASRSSTFSASCGLF